MKFLKELSDDYHRPINFLLNFIITTYLSELKSVCVISRSSDQFINYGEITVSVTVSTIESDLNPLTIQHQINNGCRGFIVYDQLTEQFFNGYHLVKDNCSQRLTNVFVVVIPSSVPSDFLTDLIVHPLISEITSLLIVKESMNQSYDLVTIDMNNNPIAIIQLDHFYGNKTFAQNAHLFPDKINNLGGRSIRLSIFNYEPYTVWKSVDTLEESNAYEINTNCTKYLYMDGTESIMMLEFCKKLNCVWEVMTVDETEWGVIYENGTGDGIVGAVVENKVDIGVGALYLWYHEYKFLGLTNMITRTGITCLVMKPHIKAGWFLPVFPFQMNLWYAVIASSVIGVIGLRIVSRFSTNKETIITSILTVFQIFVLQSKKITITQFAYLMIIVSVLLIALMIGNAYAGGLASVMTVPQYGNAIDTVQDLADSDLEWAATHDAWIFSIQQATQPMMKTILKKFRTFPKEELAARMVQQNLAFSIERLPYGHFAVGEYVTEEGLANYQIMEEDIYWEGCVAMTAKTWPLLPKFDELVLRVIASGIQKYWELNVVIQYGDKKVQRGVEASKNRKHENKNPVRLNVSHLMGVFVLLAIGNLVSFFVFLGEMFYYQWTKRKSNVISSRAKLEYEIVIVLQR